MAQERKMTPKRFLRRNRPYILLVFVLVAVVVAALVIGKQLRGLSTPKDEQPSASVPQEDTLSDSVSAPQTPAQPSTPEEEEAFYTPPFDGTTLAVADGLLVATYDEAALRFEDGAALETFTPNAEGQTARIDIQNLNTTIRLLKDSELERVCVGVLQAYYYAAPATQDITVTVLENTDSVFDAALEAPAYGGAGAVRARVRLMELGGALWCVSAIYPEGEDCAALEQTFDSIENYPDLKIKGAAATE